MAKKKSADSALSKISSMVDMGIVKDAVSTVARMVFSGVFSKINEEADMLLDKVEQRSYKMEERMLERLYSFFLLLLGGVFIVMGVYSFMLEYMHFSNAPAYLIVGAGLVLAYIVLSMKYQQKIKEAV